MHCGTSDKRSGAKIRKPVALAVSLALLLVFGVGGTLAFLAAEGGPLKNLFAPSKVTTEVVETFNGSTKSNVKIKNTGNTTAWIRAAVVVTWQDNTGNVYGAAPVAGTDYTLTLASNTGWLKGDDGFYYYSSPVNPQTEDATACCTDVLIRSCTAIDTDTAPKGYTLCVEILSSGIQSKPSSVFRSNWRSSGLTVTENTLRAST